MPRCWPPCAARCVAGMMMTSTSSSAMVSSGGPCCCPCLRGCYPWLPVVGQLVAQQQQQQQRHLGACGIPLMCHVGLLSYMGAICPADAGMHGVEGWPAMA
jgi:hypothetical protein